jgi:hypothetical protein
VSAVATLEQAFLSTGNIKSLTQPPHWDRLGALLARVGRVRGYGDFVHYHLLARGSLDVVIESDVNILDIAALAVIVREAGGKFTDLDNREVGLTTTSVLATNGLLHVALLEDCELVMRIEVIGRLIQQEDSRVLRQQRRHRHTALLTPGERVGAAQRKDLHVHSTQRCARDLLVLRAFPLPQRKVWMAPDQHRFEGGADEGVLEILRQQAEPEGEYAPAQLGHRYPIE